MDIFKLRSKWVEKWISEKEKYKMCLSENEITSQAGSTRVLTRSEPMYASRPRVENCGCSIWNNLKRIGTGVACAHAQHRNGPKQVKLCLYDRLYDLDPPQTSVRFKSTDNTMCGLKYGSSWYVTQNSHRLAPAICELKLYGEECSLTTLYVYNTRQLPAHNSPSLKLKSSLFFWGGVTTQNVASKKTEITLNTAVCPNTAQRAWDWYTL